MLKLFIATIAIAVAAGGYGGFLAGKVYQERVERIMVIANGCGGYAHDTGEFEFEKPQTAQDIMIDPLPLHKPKVSK